MYSLTKEQKLANLRETFQSKLKKYQNLEKELRALSAKIQKLESKTTSPEAQAQKAPETPPVQGTQSSGQVSRMNLQ